jgi:hypothetical protein
MGAREGNSYGVEVLVPDTSLPDNYRITRNRETHTLGLGFSSRLIYEYHFPRTMIGLHLANTNVWLTNLHLYPFWDASLSFGIKL